MSDLRSSTLISEANKAVPQEPPRTPPHSQRHVTSQVPHTPMGFGSQSEGSEINGWATVEDQRLAIQAELAGHEFEDPGLPGRAFKNISQSNKAIKDFVNSSPLYDQATKRWVVIPESPRHEPDLYAPFTELIESIVSHGAFGLSEDRATFDTHAIHLSHIEGSDPAKKFPEPPRAATSTNTTSSHDENASSPTEKRPPVLKSSPDICIQAVVKDKKPRNNFPFIPNSEEKKASYRMSVSAVEVKTNKNYSAQQNRTQISVYARQIFSQQNNRQLVTCFIVTETWIRAYIYGRDGLHYSLPINIHEKPQDFVRFILAAASLQAEIVGFDRSIYYKDGQRFIDSVDANGKPTTYPLINNDPIFRRRTIRGRGTTCWLAQNKEGEPLLVKDAWKSVDRDYESNMLSSAAGLGGVGQMRGYQDAFATISKLRHINTRKLPTELAKFQDLECCRIILDYYGRSLEGFQSRSEVLYAFYDALCGYRNLYDKGILHRDISINNILIGKPGAVAPNRGVIIDLDMAVRLERLTSLAKNNKTRTGTRAFMSINVLRTCENAPSKPHGYMDDLESFFYVLCWVCCAYSGPGRRLSPDQLSVIMRWETNDIMAATYAKNYLFTTHPRRQLAITPYFGKPFEGLVVEMWKILKSNVLAITQEDDDFIPPTLDEACNKILCAIKTAIDDVEKLEAEEATSAAPDFTPDTPIPSLTSRQRLSQIQRPRTHAMATRTHSSSGSSTGKRSRGHEDHGEAARKSKRQANAPFHSSSLSSSVADAA